MILQQCVGWAGARQCQSRRNSGQVAAAVFSLKMLSGGLCFCETDPGAGETEYPGAIALENSILRPMPGLMAPFVSATTSAVEALRSERRGGETRYEAFEGETRLRPDFAAGSFDSGHRDDAANAGLGRGQDRRSVQCRRGHCAERARRHHDYS